MNALPFGLPPIVFSIIMVVSWLTLGPLVAWFFMRKRNKRIMSTAAQFSQPAAAPSQPVYPYLAPPEQPYADLVGLWQFKSAARWIGVVIGVVFAIGTLQFPFPMNILYTVPPALIALLSLQRPTRAAQTCTVAPNLAVTLGRGGREIPLDLNNYRYIRTHTSQVRYGDNFPSMVIFDRDTPARRRRDGEQHAVPTARRRAHRDVPQPVAQRPGQHHLAEPDRRLLPRHVQTRRIRAAHEEDVVHERSARLERGPELVVVVSPGCHSGACPRRPMPQC